MTSPPQLRAAATLSPPPHHLLKMVRIEEFKTKCDSSQLDRHSLVCDSDLKGIPYPLPGNDGGHFAMIISGKPKSGKSTLALGLLTTKGKKRVYRGKFDNIIIFVPKHSLSSLKDNPFEDLDASKQFHELTYIYI